MHGTFSSPVGISLWCRQPQAVCSAWCNVCSARKQEVCSLEEEIKTSPCLSPVPRRVTVPQRGRGTWSETWGLQSGPWIFWSSVQVRLSQGLRWPGCSSVTWLTQLTAHQQACGKWSPGAPGWLWDDLSPHSGPMRSSTYHVLEGENQFCPNFDHMKQSINSERLTKCQALY